ncbi:hypothetical protein BDZ91DRAFT_698450 [Kalaharituber pfeilii]|nr:hypothetical protein BDZ91DRAFT_698450 [Kalaharituber pfeilii]
MQVLDSISASSAPPSLDGAPSRISVAVDPVALITTECITVTSAMRKHARWAQSSVAAILGGTSSGYGGVASAIPPPSPRSPAYSRGSVPGAPGVKGDLLGADAGLANRWGLRGKRGKSIQDNPLIAGFTKLRSELIGCRDIRQFDTPALLQPFLQVIRSSSTSGPITSLALIAITKFFSYNFITRDSPRLPLAMQLLASTITHCRFEASDTAHDEVVLLRILKLMERMFSGPCGEVLGDESVCEMMETILSMCCQIRLSEMLRKSAEMSMMVICQVVFERLKHLELEAGAFEQLEQELKNDMDTVKMEPAVNGDSLVTEKGKNAEETQEEGQTAEVGIQSIATVSAEVIVRTGGDPATESESDEEVEIRPYSLPSMRELLRVLVEILDPHNKTHTDTMRIMAMRIIDVAFEVAGPSIAKHPSLAGLAKDDLCRHLFQLVRSDTMTILQESLRVTGTMLSTTRGVLKLQQELYISYLVACLHPRIEIPREPGINPMLYEGVPTAPKLIKPSRSADISGRSTPVSVKERQKLGLEGGTRRPDAREAMVENIAALVRIPSFMTELYVNYDCDIDRNDLCEDVVGFLSRNAFPDSATWSTTNVPPLCLDALLHYVSFVADRLHDPPQTDDLPDPEELRKQRALKHVIIQGTAKFNEDPKKGIAYLAQQGIIDDVNNPGSIVRFLKGTTRINKTVLGDYLSKKANEPILREFIEQFDFEGKRIDEALRLLLESFRLPGESALIERIVTVFSEKYCSTKPAEVANQDAAFVLTYAMIMLNTDLHNPNVKDQNRMKQEDFARNLRAVNDKKDFDPEYLQTIYTTIKTKEIILPDEHDNKDAFDYAWKELLIKAETVSDLVICDTNIYDADMFAKTWRPIVATLSYVFMSATDDAVFSRVITGFDQCAQIATRYKLTECMDRIVQCLGIISTLSTETPPSTALNTEVKVGESTVMVSELAVKFGRDFKAQLATVVLFRVISGNEGLLREGWHTIIRCCLNLFINSLIPPYFSTPQTEMEIEPIALQSPSVVIDRNQSAKESGLLSALSSYLSSYASDEPPEPSEEELESTLCTVDCVNSCFFADIFANIMNLDITSLTCLVESLCALLPEVGNPLIIHKPDPATIPSSVNTTFLDKNPKYDPAVVYVLELATCLALRDPDATATLGKQVADLLQSVLRGAAYAHHIIVSRSIYYLLSLLERSHEHTFIRTPVILHNITTLDRSILEKSSLPIIKGIMKCLKGPTSLKNEMVISPDFWVLLRGLLMLNEAVQEVFQAVEFVTTESPSNVSSDNYVAVVTLINDFALAGSVGSVFEQKQDKVNRKAGGAKPVKLKDRPDAAVVERGTKAVVMIYQLSSRVPTLIAQSHLEKNEAWMTYWSPIFQALSTQCANPCREVRNQAFASLQRALLSPGLTSHDHHEWTAIFGDVLFPLISRLLKPEVYQSDPRGMGETRMQAATLLCKVFLHYMVMLCEWEGMVDLWVRILDVMDRLMNSGQADHLEEAVPESLKNVLLVMSSTGLLVPPSEEPEEPEDPSAEQELDEAQRKKEMEKELWEQTWKRLERFLPQLKSELYPPVAKVEKKEMVVMHGGGEGVGGEREVGEAEAVAKATGGEGVGEAGQTGEGQGTIAGAA